MATLLEHCRDDISVPASWRTPISVMAADDPLGSTAAYVPVHRPDVDGDEEHKDSGPSQILSRGPFLDLSRDSHTESSNGGGKRKRSSKRPGKTRKQSAPDTSTEIQEYPTQWVREYDDSCRPDGDLLLHDVDAAREMLKPFPLIWNQLRLDVRALILYGINYEGADRSVHGCFHKDPLLVMLLRMFWNELNGTLWTKYVPRRYFVAARAKLGLLLENDEHLDLWGPLVPVVEDLLDDETQIPERVDHTDKNWTNEVGDDGDNDDDDDDEPMYESPSKRTRTKTKRRRIAHVEAKNPAKRQHMRKTYIALVLKQHLMTDAMMIIEVPRDDKVFHGYILEYP
ncbi:hypothetical protein PHMEG_00026608 [Phytophthora megakarya]|uniref:Uncharacterized protein n=1 Tax=Phytophthora megakarya TaxID=4795 RepID=A0A225VAW2_9STRA|nr:hypothetical protein PHMEG_00026608 [Phytophthora megakarya]